MDGEEAKQAQINFCLQKPEFWEKVWQRAREESSARRKRRSLKEAVDYWNQRAENFDKNIKGKRGRKRVARVLDWLGRQGVNLDNMKVLDIGAGPGAFALAFAKRAREVVALEPAAAMNVFLKRRIAADGLKNIRIIQDAWEKVDLEQYNLKQQFDLVFASMTPGINNWETLDKALSCAQKYCFISGFAGKRQNEALSKLWQVLFGETIPDWSGDLIPIFNLLYTRGFDLSLEVWEESIELESAPEEAVLELKRELHKYGVEEHLREDGRVSEYVHDRLVNGKFRQKVTNRVGQVLIKL